MFDRLVVELFRCKAGNLLATYGTKVVNIFDMMESCEAGGHRGSRCCGTDTNRAKGKK